MLDKPTTAVNRDAEWIAKAATTAGHRVDFAEYRLSREGDLIPFLRIHIGPRTFFYADGSFHVPRSHRFHPGLNLSGRIIGTVASRAAVRSRWAASGLPVPRGRAFDSLDIARAADYAATLGGAVRIAADDRGNSGWRTSSGERRQELEQVLGDLQANPAAINVEARVPGQRVRFLYVDPQIVAVQLRRPPQIVGDGRSSVAELIAIRSAGMASRGVIGWAPLPTDPALSEAIVRQGLALTDVPDRGQVVLLSSPDDDQRADGVNCRDEVHASHTELALAAVHSLGKPRIVSLDMILADRSEPAGTGACHLVEANGAPDIAPFHRPLEGPACDAAGAVIDLLERMAAADADSPDNIDQMLYQEYLDSPAGLDSQAVYMAVALTKSGIGYCVVEDHSGHEIRRSVEFEIGSQTYRYRHGALRTVDAAGQPRHINGDSVDLTRDKAATKALLASHGIAVPSGRIFQPHERRKAVDFAERLGKPVCVKPAESSGGTRVYADLNGRAAVDAAFREVAASLDDVIIEESLRGECVRLQFVHPQIVAVKRGVLPVLTGDGSSSVLSLIDRLNEQRQLQGRHTSIIRTDSFLVRLLAEQSLELTDVPAAGREVRIARTSNASRGSIAIECRDSLHPSYWEVARAACLAIPGLWIAGVDMIIADCTAPAAEGNHWILEVNSSPQFKAIQDPWVGRPQYVADAIIDFLRRAGEAASKDGRPASLQIDDDDEFDHGGRRRDARRPPSKVQQTIQQALARMESAPAIEVATIQFTALERIVRHAARNTEFYPGRLGRVISGDSFVDSAWPEVPILRREDARANASAMRASEVPDDRPLIEAQTSGSTGEPLRFAFNMRARVATRAAHERLFAWHDLDPSAVLAEIRSFPPGFPIFAGGRAPRGWSFRDRSAPYYQLPVTTPLDRQLGWLDMVAPRYLLTYPTVARELATEALHRGLGLEIDAVLTVGEVLSPTTRDLCRTAFGAKVIDSYGCQEMGKIALECEVSGHYHVCASNVLLEVLDENDRHVSPGEVGRAVLTSLYNYATPFIRYEIGDYVRLGTGPCPCGRTLPVLTEILGRQRNMITLPDGKRMWLPGRALVAMAEFVPLRRMRFVQRSMTEFQLQYVPDESRRQPDAVGLSACATRLIHPGITIEALAVDSLPRSAGGKYEDVVGLA